MKKYFYSIIFCLLLVPVTTFALWWSPSTWFQKSETVNAPQKVQVREGYVYTSTSKQASSTVPTATQSLLPSGLDPKVMGNITAKGDGKNLLEKIAYPIGSGVKSIARAIGNRLTEFGGSAPEETGEVTQGVRGKTVAQEVPVYCDDTCKKGKIEKANIKKQAEDLAKKGKKKCLNGSIITTNEACTKSCTDGEIVAEELKCKAHSRSLDEIYKNDPATISSKEETAKKLEALLEKYTIKDSPASQCARDRANGTGMYALPQGVSLTPDQILGLRSMADNNCRDMMDTSTQQDIINLYRTNPALAEKLWNDYQNSKLRQDVRNLNDKLDTVKSNQNSLKDCINGLSTGYTAPCR